MYERTSIRMELVPLLPAIKPPECALAQREPIFFRMASDTSCRSTSVPIGDASATAANSSWSCF
jgi:hypothetical protein